jgi:hypothetical protein
MGTTTALLTARTQRERLDLRQLQYGAEKCSAGQSFNETLTPRIFTQHIFPILGNFLRSLVNQSLAPC